MNNQDNNFFGSGGIRPQQLMSLEGMASRIHEHSKRVIGNMIEYKELMMMYACAIKEIRTKLEILDTDFKVRYSRNPISNIKSRVKSTASIAKKLNRMGSAITVENIIENINDAAGVRVICSYVDDIYLLADALLKQEDVRLVEKKDYIASPKENGYRSLHLIVTVPVFFMDERREMKVEVQIRTIAMDFWASLEHQLKYKQAIDDDCEIASQLRECAEIIAKTDCRMMAIREEIEKMKDTPTEDDVMLEKLSKFDINIT